MWASRTRRSGRQTGPSSRSARTRAGISRSTYDASRVATKLTSPTIHPKMSNPRSRRMALRSPSCRRGLRRGAWCSGQPLLGVFSFVRMVEMSGWCRPWRARAAYRREWQFPSLASGWTRDCVRQWSGVSPSDSRGAPRRRGAEGALTEFSFEMEHRDLEVLP